MPFSLHNIGAEGIISTLFNTGDADLGHLVNIVSAKFLHCKAPIILYSLECTKVQLILKGEIKLHFPEGRASTYTVQNSSVRKNDDHIIILDKVGSY